MNAELRRNLWLEISPHRLIAMPVVLGLAFIVIASLDPAKAPERLAWIGLAGFAVIAALWGMRLSANSIFDELTEKTWDWQRLSTLTPWAMTWGKLLGSTAYAWYGGLLCLAVFVYYAPADPSRPALQTALTAILGALGLHAGTLASALLNARRAGGSPQNRRSFSILILLAWVYGGAYAIPRGTPTQHLVTWYGVDYTASDFMLVCVALFAAWALLGAFRAMSQSLAVNTTPWAITSFLVFLTLYSAGFVIGRAGTEGYGLQIALLMGLAWSSVCTYLLLFTEPSGPIVIRRVLRKIHLSQWQRALEEIPCWPLTWALMALCAVGLAIAPPEGLPAFAGNWAFAPLPLALLAARDAAILVFFSASPRPKRAVGTTLIYLLVLDWLVPGFLDIAGFKWLAALILPIGSSADNHWLQALAALMQAAVALAFAFRRVAGTMRPAAQE